jgi:protocatechuate 3,4-dioxygenase beta subunit
LVALPLFAALRLFAYGEEAASQSTEPAAAEGSLADPFTEGDSLEPVPTAGEVSLQRMYALGRELEHTRNVILGRCVDENEQPLAGVPVELYRYRWGGIRGEEELVTSMQTDSDGIFRFDKVVDVERDFPAGVPDASYPEPGSQLIAVAARALGRTSAWSDGLAAQLAEHSGLWELPMERAATLRGRITGPDGQPVAGATVFVGYDRLDKPGLELARTDAEGRYAIDDLWAYDAAEAKRQFDEDMLAQSKSSQGDAQEGLGADSATPAVLPEFQQLPLLVRHPDFAARRVDVEQVPGELDVELQPGGWIEGRVLYRDPDQPADAPLRPAAGVVVSCQVGKQTCRTCAEKESTGQAPNSEETAETLYPVPADTESAALAKAAAKGIDPMQFAFQEWKVRTDREGAYRFDSLQPGKYLLETKADGWVMPLLHKAAVKAGQTAAVPDMVFSRGEIVHVRFVDAESDEPIKLDKSVWDTETLITAFEEDAEGDHARKDFPVKISAEATGKFQMAAGRYRFTAGVVQSDEPNYIWVCDCRKMPVRERKIHDVVEGKSTEIVIRMNREANELQQPEPGPELAADEPPGRSPALAEGKPTPAAVPLEASSSVSTP